MAAADPTPHDTDPLLGLSLHGRTAIVTGGARNIGRSVARAFLEHGAAVVINGRDAARLAEVRDAIVRTCTAADAGDRLVGFAGDLVHDDVAEHLVAFTTSHFARVDFVTCFAGGGGADDAIDTQPAADWEAIVRNNVFTSARCARAAMAELRRSRGTMLFCSGGGAWFPETGAHHTAYAVAKAALCRLTDQLAFELLSDGVRVNCIQPGMVWNEHDLARVAQEERVRGTPHPLREHNRRPEDVATLAVWLCSERSAPLSGRLVALDDPWWRTADRTVLERIQRDVHAFTLRRSVPDWI